MAAVLLKLKWRYFLASLKGSTLELVGTIFGALYLLGILVSLTAASVGIGLSADPAAVASWVAGTWLVVSLAWTLVPLFTSGLDATLDPDHLAPYPLRPRQIQLGQLLGGFVGLFGFATLALVAVIGISLIDRPWAILGYLIAAVLGLALTMSISRVVSLLGLYLTKNPVIRQVLIIIAFVALIGLGPMIAVAFSGAGAFVLEHLVQILSGASYTPWGAPWAAAAQLYQGKLAEASWYLLLSVVYLALAWWLWNRMLSASMKNIGADRSAGAKQALSSGQVGIFARFPATPRGAIAARTLHSLVRDPRMNLNLVMVPAFYVLFSLLSSVTLGSSEAGETVTVGPNWFMMFFIPLFTGYIFAYLVSYDNSAFSQHVLAPVRGIDDRLGRAWGLLLPMAPMIVAGTCLMSFMTGVAHQLPALLGISLCLLFSGVGVAAVADMYFSIPAPPPGANPFKTPKQSDGLVKSLVRALVMLGVFLFAIPGVALLVIAGVFDQPLLLWAAGGVSLVIGVLVLWGGLRLGARRFDNHAHEALQRVSRFR
ncbi:transporter [Rothia sp. LK2588]|uniref:transporter n=1 Tax=Rothia sp. LK2588 TaxID=3114369 RepID=UPI0034CE2F4A